LDSCVSHDIITTITSRAQNVKRSAPRASDLGSSHGDKAHATHVRAVCASCYAGPPAPISTKRPPSPFFLAQTRFTPWNVTHGSRELPSHDHIRASDADVLEESTRVALQNRPGQLPGAERVPTIRELVLWPVSEGNGPAQCVPGKVEAQVLGDEPERQERAVVDDQRHNLGVGGVDGNLLAGHGAEVGQGDGRGQHVRDGV